MGRESFSARALWALGCVWLAGSTCNPAAARQPSALAHSAGPAGHSAGQKLPAIPQCAGVTLTAAYLTQVSAAEDLSAEGRSASGPDDAAKAETPKAAGLSMQDHGSDGPGFLLVIENNTDRPVKLAHPIPTSAHWYAQTGAGPWLWRASTGSGGALVNAISGEHGPLQVYPAAGSPPATLIVPAHARIELAESMRDHPILRFRPGCEHCSNPQDERYRAVLAYAYMPPPGDRDPALLSCGLRSGPIVMPPLQ